MKTVREFIWVILARAIVLFSSIALVSLLTHALTVLQYSEFVLAMTICNALTPLVLGALGQGVGRIYVDIKCKQEFYVFKNACKLIINRVLLGYIFVFITVEYILFCFDEIKYMYYLLPVILYSFFYGLNDISVGLQNLSRNRIVVTKSVLIESVIKITTIYIFSILFELNVMIVILCYLAATIASLFYNKMNLNKLDNFECIDRLNDYNDQINKILRIALPAAVWGVFVWIQQASDKWALAAFADLDSVGKYNVLFQIGFSPFSLGMSVIMSMYTPIIYKSKDINIVFKLIASILIITLIVFVFAYFYSMDVFRLVVDNRYIGAANLLPYMIVAAGFFQSGEILIAKLMSYNKARLIMFVKIFTSIICVFANVCGARALGLNGVVYSAVIFGFLYFLLALIFLFTINSEEDNYAT